MGFYSDISQLVTARNRSESLVAILNAAILGIPFDRKEADRSKKEIMEGYINILIRYGLVSREGNMIYTQEFYNGLDKEALPYALDRLIWEETNGGDKSKNEYNKPQGEIETEILEEFILPRYRSHFAVTLSLKNPEEFLTSLMEKDYITAIKDKRGRTVYEITEKGSNLLQKINECVKQLNAYKNSATQQIIGSVQL